MKYFGTDGFRGEANIGLTVEHAYKIGRYLGYKYKKEESGRIVIGKDTRRSSYMYENALAAGITASGSDAYLLHVTTTPNVSYTVRIENFDCGIMISASHNPYYDNGIKLFGKGGLKMDPEILMEVESFIDGEIEIPFATRGKIGSTIDYYQGRNRYIGYLISTATRSFKGIKVGLDTANGASFMIAKNVFDALGAETRIINNRPNGLNINEKAGSTHIEGLVDLVKNSDLDVGFAYDGDADRCIAVDSNGTVMDGDYILYICGTHFKNEGELYNNTIVTTVMSNIGLFKALDREGIKYVKTDVGDKYVAKEMVENGYVIGGEQSGHIIFSKFAQSGDGILTSLRMMEVMLANKTAFENLHRDLVIYPQVLKNVNVKDKEKVLDDQDVKDEIKKVEDILDDDGRILVRKSGTEPLIRVMVEAESHDDCEKYASQVEKLIYDKGYGI